MASKTAPVANGHRLLTFAELRELPLPFEDVTLPELGGVTIRLNAILGSERAVLAGKSQAVPEESEAQMLFVHEVIAATMPDASPEEVGKLPATVIDKLTVPAMRMAGIGERAVRDAVKALKATPSDESGSA